MSSKPARSKHKAIIAIIVLVILASTAVWGYSNRHYLSNLITAAQFEPSERIKEIAATLEFTDAGETNFYATRPELTRGTTFSENCNKVALPEASHVLGCYLPEENRINLLDVRDDRLYGIVEVTAAHELLHSEWEYMPPTQRDRLAGQLQSFYDSLMAENPDFIERMSVYAELSSHDFQNELHSVIGTELADIPESLELHYAEIFQNRRNIVKLYQGYNDVFAQLQEQSEQLQNRLEQIREEYDIETATLSADIAAYNNDLESFERRNQAYEFSDDPQLFERIKSSLESRRVDLERRTESLKAYEAEYEELRARLAAVNQINSELDQQLDGDISEIKELE